MVNYKVLDRIFIQKSLRRNELKKNLKTIKDRIDVTQNLVLIIIVCLAIRIVSKWKMHGLKIVRETGTRMDRFDRKKEKKISWTETIKKKKNNIKLINFSTLYIDHRNTYTFQNCPVINVLINHIRILMTFSLTNACKKNVVTRSCCGKYRSPRLYYKEKKKKRERKREGISFKMRRLIKINIYGSGQRVGEPVPWRNSLFNALRLNLEVYRVHPCTYTSRKREREREKC